MITIDQLLGSVDLDFEPKFVTKDETGVVELWEKKPHKTNYGCWSCYGWQTRLAVLKLAEFDGKDWTECIYEVPQKTTGKIEKLLEQKLTIGKTKYEYPTHAMMMDKINELVDAVNELKGE